MPRVALVTGAGYHRLVRHGSSRWPDRWLLQRSALDRVVKTPDRIEVGNIDG